ncbi:DUF4350 domain-containing protein [Demequina zhanjiangensis]|uniref:DUF4350 domain-containing protein n=1 Tax=Demequina zhanjiangensis TaxID=3051659 RepID=A0ABT8FXQ0_9MICO|nr:DUF4350 domain-containing protein [Demequina sp. SYSU T00b26]MDN4471685.1 DUF4350 domain-containing protein [Demequina sp. SYSU T00b26]
MSRTVTAPEGWTLGDGSTAGKVASARWSRVRWLAIVLTLVVVGVLVATFARPSSNSVPLSIDNTGSDGARAVAQILRGQGVDVQEVSTLSEAYRALDGGGTLALASYVFLDDDQVASIATHPGDVVWIEPAPYVLSGIDPALSASVPTVSEGPVPARCAAPAAQSAVSLTDVRASLQVSAGAPAEACFVTDGSATYVELSRDGERPVHVLADAGVVTNGSLAVDGAAALALHVLGHDSRLVWYVGDDADDTLLSADQTGSTYLTPRAPEWLTAGMIALLLVALVAAFHQGRRMGPLVTEPLPVIVRASEATRGRGRLYRRGKARGHAAAALRAGAASRLAARLSLSRHSQRAAVVSAIALHTRRDPGSIDSLLYGPPPADDAAFMRLVAELDALESEVSAS